MAVSGGVHGGYFPSKFGKLSAKLSSQNRAAKQSPPPIFISTDPAHVNPLHLRDLYSLCNHSAHRFPNRDSNGLVEPVEVNKLRIAISHSSAVVSVFTKPDFDYNPPPESEISNLIGIGGDWIQRLMPLSPANGLLVGFGRAVSDAGLTASIYDVMVIF